MKGFNLNSLKELNKVKIYTVDKSGKNVKPVNTILTAYTSKGLNYQFGFNQSIIGDAWNNMLNGDGIATQALRMVASSMDLAVGVDIERKGQFAGARPLKFSLDCFLTLDNDYKTDIADPLNGLLDFFLPSRGEEVYDKENLKSDVDKLFEDSDSDSPLYYYWSKLQNGLKKGIDFVGDVYKLKPPKQLNYQTDQSLVLKYGSQTIAPIIITDISLSFPSYMMVDVTSGGTVPVPDHVNISLQIETMRVATTGLVKF